MGETDRELEAEQKNGVYLLEVKSEFEGYTIHSATDVIWADAVTINGNYVGTSGYFETECDDFEIDGDTVHLRYHGTGINRPDPADPTTWTCDACGEQVATDADYGWVCLDCGEPRSIDAGGEA